nr:PREDICTED: ubiquitin-like modifier-activating enzyme 7 isoform X1 [Anolis carolinensis]XP_008103216.1 PREDICTED: ubiquitin-like modifier-activating enzyme 7 isoform X1 [Anolis carolinensis]|eukprot:XP_008103215.1 PREDICTED: ubiquitin-like modifier-activating enzyme 7 isoform X1 [Anolis carolinensis]
MNASESLPEIDEGLYSRQLYMLGREAMQKMAQKAVLVSGMQGLGVEIAKNVILAGVKSVTVHDQNKAQWSDLSSQFYLSEGDVGQNRAMVSQRHLDKLNSHVSVIAHTERLSESFLSTFQIVVLTNSSLEEQLRISDFCHANNICLVIADTKGLAGQLFCDFGECFVVYDPSEADPVSATIDHITQGNPGILTVAWDEEQRQHPHFEDVDWVIFSEVEGMTELNDSKPRLICVRGECSLEIGDTSSFSPYKCGGIITQVKMPQKYFFKSLCDSMAEPKISTPDKGKLSYYHTLHTAFWAMHVFWSEMCRLPKPRDQADADKMVELSQTLTENEESLQNDLIRTFSYGCAGNLSPVNAFIGGLAAQEVLKAASGKFAPLDQWLYFDAYECLPESNVQLTAEDCAPCNSRYDGQIAVFGTDFQEQLGKQKYFMVGAGAIGCELLKNFAMMGLAAGMGGSLTVTDMDTIEYSNLNRQFLFRQQDVSKLKSEVAATAIKFMNPKINVVAEQNQVGPETEHFYGDDFFLRLDGVVNALDTFQAREYVGKRCVQYLKPLLDSGTHGARGHVQVCVPFLTEPYGQAQDMEEKEHPFCTLRHFPTTIQHAVQWARDQFEGLFKMTAENTNKFLKDLSSFETQEEESLETLERVHLSLQKKPDCWKDCVLWARSLWEHLFSHDIQQLLHIFPPEHETSSGLPFWSGSKRCPRQLDFDCGNDMHMTFILAASRLFAQMYRLPITEDIPAARQVLFDLHLPSFQPHQGMHIPLTDEEIQEAGSAVDKKSRKSAEDQRRLAELKQKLAERRQEMAKHSDFTSSIMIPIHFEKDDNTHLDFITSAANLRAKNYGIPLTDTLQAKRIVGRIVPAIVTTTAAVAGLVCLELYKLVWRHRDLSSYRSSFLQPSEPLFSCFQPRSAPQSYKYHQKTWNSWDRIEVPGYDAKGEEITLRDLCSRIQREHNLVPRMLLFQEAILYAEFWEKRQREQQLSYRLTEAVCQTSGEPVSPEQKLLVLSIVCEDEEADNDLPPVHVWLQPVKTER